MLPSLVCSFFHTLPFYCPATNRHQLRHDSNQHEHLGQNKGILLNNTLQVLRRNNDLYIGCTHANSRRSIHPRHCSTDIGYWLVIKYAASHEHNNPRLRRVG